MVLIKPLYLYDDVCHSAGIRVLTQEAWVRYSKHIYLSVILLEWTDNSDSLKHALFQSQPDVNSTKILKDANFIRENSHKSAGDLLGIVVRETARKHARSK